MKNPKPKFEKGENLKVVRRSGFTDKGSVIRKNFVVESRMYITQERGWIYRPTDQERGAFENQLEYSKINNWKKVMAL